MNWPLLRVNRWLLVLAWTFIVASAFYLWSEKQRREHQNIADARAVTTLPVGVQRQWESYVAQRLSQRITSNGRQLRLKQDFDDTWGVSTVVSINTPYTVHCDDVTGVEVNFGDDIGVTAFGLFADDEPPLGVDEKSVAAKRLRALLCETVIAYMRSVTEP